MNRSDNLLGMAAGQPDFGDLAAIRSGQQLVADLAHKERSKNRDRIGRIQQPNHAEYAVRDWPLQLHDEEAGFRAAASVERLLYALHNVTQGGQVKFKDNAEIGLASTTRPLPGISTRTTSACPAL